MAKKGLSESKKEELVVQEVEIGEASFALIGASPFVFHRLSEKARQQLLYPRARRMGSAEKASNLKHVPLTEYRETVYRNKDDGAVTRLKFPSVAFKRAIANAALDIEGAAKSEIGRLVSAQWEDVQMWGTPKLYMAVVRQSGVQKTPDIRTRAILPRWCTTISFTYMCPKINYQTIANLLTAAGMICGIGDGRQEKGAMSFGKFRIASVTDPEFLDIQKEGREAQDAALADPEFYDDETEDMYKWFYSERERRGDDGNPARRTKKSNAGSAIGELHA